jgi:protease-4
MSYFVLEGALGELGIQPVVIKSTNADAWKDEGSPFRQPSEREQAHLLALLDHYQAQFEQVVVEGRGDRLNPEPELIEETLVEGGVSRDVRVEKTEPLNGKIYVAARALELGLIDEIGFLSDAIDRAAELAELDKPNVLKYQRRRSFMAQLFSARSAGPLEQGRELVNELQTPRFEMIWRVD